MTGSRAVKLTRDQTVTRRRHDTDMIGKYPVATEAALNSTIACFNSLTTAGNYTFTLTADINLTASTTVINNSTTGVELHIDGDGHRVDGQDQSGVRPFEVAANTDVTLSQITLTGGKIIIL